MIEEIHRLALETLRNHLTAAGASFAEEDGDLLIGEHRLGLSIAFDGFAEQGGQKIAPLEAQIHLDGDTGDRFRVGTLGIGDTPDDAIHSAIEEWHVLAAAPLLAALDAAAGTRLREPRSTLVAGWSLFAGRAGIRGAVPAGLHAGGAFYQQLLGTIHDTVADWKAPDKPCFRSIFVMANAVGAQREAQAAVDGFVDEKLGETLRQLSWPASAEAYFFKQLFVLRRP